MFLTNTAVPTATFVMGLLTEGISYDLTFPNDMSVSSETDNPLAGLSNDEGRQSFEEEDSPKKKSKE